MVSTLFKSSIREIRQSLGRYLAIMAIIALGVGFFAGVRMSQPDMIATGSEYLDTYNLYDFRLISTLGFTDEDVDAFAAEEAVSKAQGSYYREFLWNTPEGDENVLIAHSLTEEINDVNLLYGRMPRSADECLVDALAFSSDDLGRQINVSENNDEDTLDLLAYEFYTIVGIVESPLYMSNERGTSSIGTGSVNGYVLIPEEGFDSDIYYEIYITLNTEAAAYSKEYEDLYERIEPEVKALLEERADIRYTTLYSDAADEIAEGEEELSDGWKKYYRNKANTEQNLLAVYDELTNNEKLYVEKRASYEENLAAYEASIQQLSEAKATLDTSFTEGQQQIQQELAKVSAAVEAAQNSYDQTRAALEAERSKDDADQVMIEQLQQQLLEAEHALNVAQSAYNDTKVLLAEKSAAASAEYSAAREALAAEEATLDTVKQQLDVGGNELEGARIALDSGWASYYSGKATANSEFSKARKELEDGEADLLDAKEQLVELEEPVTYLLGRNENAGYVGFDNDTSIIKAISIVFPVFFFLVAALVCMTTMTRMVDEQRTQIGVLKAIGYSNWQIIGKYLMYSGSAAIIGSVIGYAIGSFCLPWVIWEIYGIIYGFAELNFIFDPVLAILSIFVAVLCSVGATYAACQAELRKPAAELIRPKAPKAGKRVFLEYITPIWSRLSFLHKVTARNVLRYKSRLVMMILGIGGCTALLVTGFGIRDSVQNIADDQFDKITLYDYSVNFNDPITEESLNDFLSGRDWSREEALIVHSSSIDVSSDSAAKSAYLVVSSENTLDGFIDLHSEDAAIAYPGYGEVVINYALARELGISQGDTIELYDESLGIMEATVSGICDNYISNYVFLSEETYERQFGTIPEYKTLYLHQHDGADPYEESVALSDSDTVSSVTVNQSTRDMMGEMLGRLDYIVIVVVICAAALAFIVLYNLTNINITERIREIATIKVLGFYRTETASYVFREINILALLGSLIGLLMGKGLHAFVMAQVKVDAMFFPCKIISSSYLISLILTIVFTCVITAFLRPKLNRIDMAESLKSIE